MRLSHRSIEDTKCSSEFPQNIPRKFRGTSVWGFKISNVFYKRIDRWMYVQKRYHRVDTYEFEIQITTKIEAANEVTWTSFLKVDVKPLVEISWRFPPCGSFFVDKNKKVALIWDNYNCNRAYVIGEDNYFARVALGESQCWPLVCSYVPSSVQIQRGPVHAPGKRKVRDY
uniref:F-box associated beta-propeller type 1 domain-containing protein n=1 Tax=Brassica oleracea var. oleracea TaxID=109376 RepID=A0A0D3CID9_BRAOL